jgi:hypothetical protein
MQPVGGCFQWEWLGAGSVAMIRFESGAARLNAFAF